MRRTDIGKLTLNVAIDGVEGAPWIVLSNSLGSNLSMWTDQIGLLTQKYRVLRYDHRGHGLSDAPEGPYSWDQLTGDVIGLMDALEIEIADWMGLSMGSMTGLGLAIHHGPRFGRFVLADGRANAPEPFRAMWDGRIATVRNGGLAALTEPTLAMWLTDGWRTANPMRTAEIRNMILGTSPEGYIACCHGLQTLDYLKDAGRITNEVLCLTGSEDKGATPDVVRAVAGAIPNGRYVEIADAGHVSNINQPGAFNVAVADFLRIG